MDVQLYREMDILLVDGIKSWRKFYLVNDCLHLLVVAYTGHFKYFAETSRWGTSAAKKQMDIMLGDPLFCSPSRIAKEPQVARSGADLRFHVKQGPAQSAVRHGSPPSGPVVSVSCRRLVPAAIGLCWKRQRPPGFSRRPLTPLGSSTSGGQHSQQEEV
ncbi:hypothetical protein ACOKM5_19965 [Streptomyces sp. BH097]|uniref:hypothetical protein n=1 Tax=unclassified Streptomyces TaxID=2593676 RepID=UPI003BB4C5AA